MNCCLIDMMNSVCSFAVRDYPQSAGCFERHPIPDTIGMMHIQPRRDYGDIYKAYTGPTANEESCL